MEKMKHKKHTLKNVKCMCRYGEKYIEYIP